MSAPGSRGVPCHRARASIPGVALVLAIAVVVSAAAGGIALAQLSGSSVDTDRVRFSVSVQPTTARIALRHRAGPVIDVRRIRVRIAIDGTPLAEQPPVPFFAAEGFRGGPTGPFNSAADPHWTIGERASVRIAGTNHPTALAGRRITVRVYRGGTLLGVASTRAPSAVTPPSAEPSRRSLPGDTDRHA